MNLARPLKGMNILGESMSDMLQLVVETQTLKQWYYWRRTLSVLNPHDKLKHIGH